MAYFTNIDSLQKAKELFRTLSKKLHPDMQGGNSASFVAMKAEYDKFVANFGKGKYTYAQSSWSSAFDTEDWISQVKAAVEKQQREAREFAERQRREREARNRQNPWDYLVENDIDYKVIKGVFLDHLKSGKSLNSLILDIYKMEGLGLKHFQFVAYLFKTNHSEKEGIRETTVNSWYKNYVAVKSVEIILD